MTRHLDRRHILKLFGSAPLWAMAAQAEGAGKAPAAAATTYLMPDEGERHAATWMAYGATAEAWGTGGAYGASRLPARRDLMRIAVNLSRYEPVKMLVSAADLPQARQLLAEARAEAAQAGAVYSGGAALNAVEQGGPIELIARTVNDLWIRDTGPVFVRNKQGQQAGVDFNFNGWGQENTGAPGWARDPEKARNGVQAQEIAADRKVAQFILQRTGTPKVKTWLVMEGGGIEVDGHGTAICTESCILNRNRNPGRSKAEVERELGRILGIRKVIWLPGVRAQEITDGHIDFYARFVGRGRVVYGLDTDQQSSEYAVTHKHKDLLGRATDADGQSLEIIPLEAPDAAKVRRAVMSRMGWTGKLFNADSFAAGYVGFYLANNCVLMAQFGDPAADRAAFETLADLYPDRVIMQIPTDGLANGGGTIHCATQQQPA